MSMKTYKAALWGGGGLFAVLLTLLVFYAVLMYSEGYPLHLEVKEPINAVNSDALPGNIALPSVVESVDPEYLLTNIYTVAHAPTPVFGMVDTDESADSVNPNGEIRLGLHHGAIIEFATAPGNVTIDGDPLGGDPVPPVGVVVIKSDPLETVIIPGVGSRGGSVNPGLPGDTSDNTAQLNLYSVSVLNVGWTDFSVNGGPVPVGDAVPIAAGARVVITGGASTIVGLSNGVDTCQTRVIVGRARAPSTAFPADTIHWVDFSGKASEVRISGLLSLTMPELTPTADVEGVLHVDTGADTNDGIARNLVDGTPDDVTDTSAMRLASIPLPTVAGDPDDGLVALSLGSGTRFALPAYSDTPDVREVQLVISIPDVGDAEQCAAIGDTDRWEQPVLGTITARETYCGGVPLGGAVGQALVKSNDDDCAVEWATLRTVPDGGMNDEVLTWETTSSEAGTYGWAGP